MTSSFQSTSFRSSANPVDTFVAPPNVQPKTGIQELASALSTLNPAIQKLIPGFIEKDIEKEEKKGAYFAIKDDLKGGKIAKLVTKARKEKGQDAANEIIGGSPAFRQGFAEQRSLNSLLKIGNVLDTEYKKKRIDVLDIDGNPTGKTKPLYAFPLGSSQVQDFVNGITSSFVDDITPDVDEETINDVFLPKLQETLADFNTKHTKQHNAYNKNLILAESTTRIKENSKIFLKAQTFGFRNPEAKTLAIQGLKEDFKQLDTDMRNAGITGSDATKFNEDVISNIVSIGDLAVTQGNFNYAAKLVNFLGESIPGSSPGKTLKDNPKWLEKTTEFFTDIYEKEVENSLRPEKLRKAKRRNLFTSRIEDYRNETDPILKNQKYKKLQLDFQEKEFKTNIDEFGVLDNQTFTEKANQFKKDLRNGLYIVDGEPDKGDAFRQLDIIERLDPTPDSESQAVLKDLEIRIKEMKGYALDLEKSKTKIMNDAKSALSRKNRFAGRSLSNKDAKLLLRYERILNDEIDERMDEFEEENKRPMTKRDAKEMLRDLDNLLKLELKVFTESEAGVEYIPEDDAIGKPGSIVNPFTAADRKKNPIKQPNTSLTPQDQETKKILKDDSFDMPPLKGKGVEGGAASEVTQADIDREKALDAEEPTTITVKKGDTLFGLSKQFKTTVERLKTLNNIADADVIKEGQELKIKEDNVEPELNYSDDSRVQSIVKSANELGISPIVLAAVIAQESSFRPTVVSVDKATGKKYTGLIQFGPYEIAKYNIKENMTFEEQMVAVTSFLRDRGVMPGHGAKEIYAAIFTGNVSNLDKGGADWTDSNGTTVNKALPNLLEGGSKYKMAIDFLQQTGTYAPKPN